MAAIRSSSVSPAGGVIKTMSTMEIFTVSRYSKTARMSPGQVLRSKPFAFHGRSWRIKVYPTGVDRGSRDFVSVFLKCCTEPFRCFAATVAMEIVDRTGEHVVFDDATAASGLAAASDGFGMGYAKFARRSELEVTECMSDDGFTIRVTLQVVGAKSPKPAFRMVPRMFTNNKCGHHRDRLLPPLPPPLKSTSSAAPPASNGTAAMGTSVSTTGEHEVETGSHKLIIDQFSRKKKLLAFGECVRSRQLSVGGSNWYIKVYPNGYEGDAGLRDGVAFVLARGKSDNPECTAEFMFQVEGLNSDLGSLKSETATRTFDRANPERLGYHHAVADLQSALLTRQDVLVVRCGLGVFRGTPPSALLAETPKVTVPPRDHAGSLWLLQTEEGSDVTFAVGDTTFRAHSSILAAQSPVLRAELRALREDAESAWRYIEVDSTTVTPEAFEALLHVAYTDHLPDMADLDLEPTDEVVQALVFAAEKYGMERLRLRTEEWVCKFVNPYTVADFLSMAVRYDCQLLKDTCVQFATPDHIWKLVKETDAFKQLRAFCPQIVTQIESKQRQHLSV